MNLNRLYQLCIGAVSIIVLQGCSTVRSGGAPDPAFDIDKDLSALRKHFNSSDSIEQYYAITDASQAKAARNKFIASRLVAIDLRYLQFVRSSTSERQAIDSATDILVMSLGLAGASLTSATTKTILAASSAAVSGTKTTLDKNYYLEKTIPALIASMNAQRAEALVHILEGTKQEIDDYTFEKAVTDLHTYYNAGTFMGAIQSIQSEASVKETKANDQIQQISNLTVPSITQKSALTSAIGQLTAGDVDKAKAVLTAAGQAFQSDINLDQAKVALQSLVRAARTNSDVATLASNFKANQIIH